MMATLAPTLRVDTVGDAKLIALAREFGTPLYVYDLEHLRERVERLRAALRGAGAKLLFATMANDRRPVLRTLAELGLGACVNSIPHLELARAAGFATDAIQFTSTGITRPDMRVLQQLGIRANLDSIPQLRTWFDFGSEQAGIRLNAASLIGAREGDRIGIDAQHLGKALAVADRRGRRVSGVHVYVGTNFQRVEEMLPTLEAFFEVASRVRTLSYVNIGGGIGVDYQHAGLPFDVEAFGRQVADYANRLRNSLGRWIDVLFEPGRALVASCATFVTTVTDVKVLNGQRFAGVDASVAVFPRPFHHPDSPHRIRELRGDGHEQATTAKPTTVVGRTTFSRDILGSVPLRRSLEAGALLAFEDAGAYCESMASRFLGQPEPAEAWLGSDCCPSHKRGHGGRSL